MVISKMRSNGKKLTSTARRFLKSNELTVKSALLFIKNTVRIGKSQKAPQMKDIWKTQSSRGKCDWLRTLAALLFAFGVLSCAGGRHYHPIPAEGPPPTPRYLELERETQVATLHFPAGVYSLKAADDVGYYYAAPGKIIQHTGDRSRFRNGGIYVNKRDPRRLRGYIYLAGALTHVGNLSRVKHEFRDEELTTNGPAFDPPTSGRHE